MTPVSRLGRAIVAMRSRTVASTDRASAMVLSSNTADELPAREQARRDVALRLQAVDLDTPTGRRQGVRAFLQVVLLSELGDGLMRSPRFVEMLGEIQDVIEADPQTHSDLMALLNDMKTGK